jgi:hypothetical protein
MNNYEKEIEVIKENKSQYFEGKIAISDNN